MKNFQTLIISLNKFYLFNFAIIATLITIIITNFVIQFKVESLQNHLKFGQSKIESYHEKITMLEIEWTYLTRPSRIRDLASKFLESSTYAATNQIKNQKEMEEFYVANYQRELGQQLAANF